MPSTWQRKYCRKSGKYAWPHFETENNKQKTKEQREIGMVSTDCQTIMNRKDCVRVSPFWKVRISFAGTMLIALVTFLYYLISWASSSTSIVKTRYDFYEIVNAAFQNAKLESFSCPETTWLQDVYLNWYYCFVPGAICFATFLSVLLFLYLALQILAFHSPCIKLEDGREVTYVSQYAEEWSSKLFKLLATVSLYSIVASALVFAIILIPYMKWFFELFRILLEILIKSLSIVPDGFKNHFELYIYVTVVYILGAASLLVVTFHYHFLLYLSSSFLTKRLPGLSNVFLHLSQQDSDTKKRKTVEQMIFYFKDFLRFSGMYVLYGFLLLCCTHLIINVFPICSIMISTDKPAYKIQTPSEENSNEGLDDTGILTINLSGFVRGDVRVKIVPRNQYTHIIDCKTYKKLDNTNLFNTGDTFGYKYYFPLKDLSRFADNCFIVDVLVGKGLMECDCLRFQENFNLIEYRATDLEYNARAEELQKKAFLTPDC